MGRIEHRSRERALLSKLRTDPWGAITAVADKLGPVGAKRVERRAGEQADCDHAKALVHIAIEPEHQAGNARVVPVGLVAAADASGVELRCSLDELTRLPDFREVEFVPYIPDFGDLGATIAWPYYGASEQQLPVLVDRIPAGEVGIRRHEQVHAADGAIGQVEGLVVDGESHITHVLLQEGHLWGQKEVAIPIGSVEKIDADGIHVQLSKGEIADLPELGVNPTW